MKLWKIENNEDGLIYYYDDYYEYWNSFVSLSDFFRRAKAIIILMPSTNSILKSTKSFENLFNLYL